MTSEPPKTRLGTAAYACVCCGKPLSDPLSMSLGIGPICRINQKLKEAANVTRSLFASRADYTYELDGNAVCIVDHDSGMSVTNDADRVLAEIACDGLDLASYRVIYRDTMGVWDEIIVAGGRFAGFKSINEQDRAAAIAKLRA